MECTQPKRWNKRVAGRDLGWERVDYFSYKGKIHRWSSQGALQVQRREQATRQVKSGCTGNQVCRHLAGGGRFLFCGVQRALPGPGKPLKRPHAAQTPGSGHFPKTTSEWGWIGFSVHCDTVKGMTGSKGAYANVFFLILFVEGRLKTKYFKFIFESSHFPAFRDCFSLSLLPDDCLFHLGQNQSYF